MKKVIVPNEYCIAALESVGRLIDGKATDDESENLTYFFNRVIHSNGRLFNISCYGKNRRIRKKARKRIVKMAVYRYAWYLWYTSIYAEEVTRNDF